MPANEEIYRPFDFRFIFAQPAWEASAEGAERTSVPAGWTETDPERTEKLSRWTDRWLADRYQVFAIRSPGYIRRMDRELASENGQWTFLYKENRLCGIICEWGRKTREQRLCYAENSRQTGERPAIMGRGKLQVCFFACFAERLGRPAIRWVLNYALTFRTATAAATTATMIMAKPITLALSPVLGMDTVGSRMMGVLLAFQVAESLWL